MAGTLQTFSATKTPQRIQNWLAPNDSVLLVNNDITNQVFLGNDPGVQSVPIPPLGSLALSDTRKDVWISTGGINVTVQILILPSGTQWTPSPAQVAAQINALGLAKDTSVQATTTAVGGTTTAVGGTTAAVNATPNTTAALIATGSPGGTPGGVPLLRFTNPLGSAAAQTLAALASSTIISAKPITQPGYEGSITVNLPASAGANPFVQIQLTWLDSISGQTIKQLFYVLTAGNGPSNALQYYINGPCYGDILSVVITNLDTTQTLTYSWVLNQTSHVHLTDNILQSLYTATAPNGFANPGGTPSLGILCIAHPTINASTTTTRLLAAYSGKVRISIDNTGNANSMWLGLLDPTGSLYSNIAFQTGAFINVANGVTANVEMALPRGPLLLAIRNTGATNNIAPGIIIVTEDY